MKKRLLIFLLTLICLASFNPKISFAQKKTETEINLQALEPFSQNDSILILAPHPDDEILGCSGVIQRAVKAGAKVRLVFLTNGDSNELAFIVYEKRLVFKKKAFLYLGEVRRKESILAMQLLGLPQDNLIFLGYPDFGTMAIFKNYWNKSQPYTSLLTRVSNVPYPDDFSYGKPYKAENILADMKFILREFKPNKIFLTSPIDTNADHRALYLFLRLALLELGEEFSKDIKVYSYLVHHYNWPKPRHFHPELKLTIPSDMLTSDYAWYNLDLNEGEINKKHNSLLVFKSQTESSAFYLLSFVRKNELFFRAPDIKLKNKSSDNVLAWSSKFNTSQAKEDRKANYSGGETSADNSADNNVALSFARDEKNLLIKISPLKQPFITNFSIYLFGYKKQVAFPEMPKIRLKIIGNAIDVLNGRIKMEVEGVNLKKEDKDIIITLPVSVLNEPEVIFCSVNTSLRSLSYDSNAWSVITLK